MSADQGDLEAVAAEENDNGPLLERSRNRKNTCQGIIILRIFVASIVICVLILGAVAIYRMKYSNASKKVLIFMISDGMGPASMGLARSYYQKIYNESEGFQLTMDENFIGSSRTRSSNSLITDSAAGATAFSCGIKTFNEAIAVGPDFAKCGTVLEAAHFQGFATGLVVVSEITDATPASFAAHATNRWMQDQIALDMIGHGDLGFTTDLLLGGGICHFLPNSTTNSCRADDTDVLALADDMNYRILKSSSELNQYSTEDLSLPVLGLFAKSTMDLEIDRKPDQPSLSEMTRIALDTLWKQSNKGFFLMVEGSSIDKVSWKQGFLM